MTLIFAPCCDRRRVLQAVLPMEATYLSLFELKKTRGFAELLDCTARDGLNRPRNVITF